MNLLMCRLLHALYCERCPGDILTVAYGIGPVNHNKLCVTSFTAQWLERITGDRVAERA